MFDDHYELVPLDQLTEGDLAIWQKWVAESELLGSPFHQPELLLEVAKAFKSCRALMVRSQHGLKAMIPVNIEGRCASAIPMCDYQTVCIAPGEKVDIRRAMRKLGIETWRYTSASIASPLASISTYHAVRVAPQVNTQGSWKDYQSRLKRSPMRLKHIQKGSRRLAREFGPVSLDYDCRPEGRVDRMLDLKRRRLALAPFSAAVRDVLTNLIARRSSSVQGVFSLLRAGEEEVAYVYTLRTPQQEFGWFYAFDPKFGSMSPGHVLIYMLIEHLFESGRATLDLGPGEESWKEFFADAASQVVTGRIDCSQPRAVAVNAVQSLFRRIKR